MEATFFCGVPFITFPAKLAFLISVLVIFATSKVQKIICWMF